MGGKVRKSVLAITILLLLTLAETGCTQMEQTASEKKKLEFTVVREADIPEELQAEIGKHKKEGFRTTFCDTQYLYIAAGYGEQQTGGYSVAVEELYMDDEVIHLKTKLIGPQKGEQVNQVCTYPYLVIKLELREGRVEYE